MTPVRFPHLPAEGWELYLRDELAGSSLRSVESHLDACAACREALEASDSSRIFRRLRGLPIREAALAGIWEAVAAEIQEAPVALRRERFALLAGVATLVLGVVLLQPMRQAESPQGASLSTAGPCIRLALSNDECRGLFVDVRFDAEPTLVVEAAADLSELL